MPRSSSQIRIELGRAGARVQGDVRLTYRAMAIALVAALAVGALAAALLAPAVRDAAIGLTLSALQTLLGMLRHNLEK